ncbi:hypothetical protein CP8484711_1796B, partial [Chlamydia psittaci 84-8471/1]
FRSCYDLEQ